MVLIHLLSWPGFSNCDIIVSYFTESETKKGKADERDGEREEEEEEEAKGREGKLLCESRKGI